MWDIAVCVWVQLEFEVGEILPRNFLMGRILQRAEFALFAVSRRVQLMTAISGILQSAGGCNW